MTGTPRLTRDAGGLRIVTDPDPGSAVATVGVWVEAGSRDEPSAVAGACHFLEHLLFKGTPERDALAIAVAMDEVGGDLDAFTTKEYTAYVARVPADALTVALDVLGDVVTVPAFRPDHVEAERQVILDELAMQQDDPEDLLHVRLGEAQFPDHPLGREVVGVEASVAALEAADLRSFHAAAYGPDRLIVGAAGAVDHEVVASHLGQRLAERPVSSLSPRQRPPAASADVAVVDREGEQAHIAASWRTFGHGDERRSALAVANHLLGEGPSSRLFQRVREERGLSYSVWSTPTLHSDTGALTVAATTAPSRVAELVDCVAGVLAEVAEHGFDEDEVARARRYLRGATVCALEDSGGRLARLASQVAVDDALTALDEELAQVDAVTAEDAGAVVREILEGPLVARAVGPGTALAAAGLERLAPADPGGHR